MTKKLIACVVRELGKLNVLRAMAVASITVTVKMSMIAVTATVVGRLNVQIVTGKEGPSNVKPATVQGKRTRSDSN